MKFKKYNQGFLMIVAAVLIVIVGLMGITLSYIFAANAYNSSQNLAAKKALALAETGLEQAAFSLLNPKLTSARQSCTTLNAQTQLAEGLVNISNSLTTPSIYYATSTLRDSNITTSLHLNNTSRFAPSGRVYINNEAIDYLWINGNYLAGINRQADNTLAGKHRQNDRVVQFQCPVQAIAQTPNDSPLAKRHLKTHIQVQQLWAVGDKLSTLQWNKNGALNWSSSNALQPSRDLLAVSLVNYADGWAVGENKGNNLTILRWNPPQTWQDAKPKIKLNKKLYDVASVSSRQAWAVGQRDNKHFTLLMWAGGNSDNWCLVDTEDKSKQEKTANKCNLAAIKSKANRNQLNLYGIAAIDTNGDGFTNLAFAVGGSKAEGLILKFAASKWQDTDIMMKHGDIGRLYDAFIVPPPKGQIAANEAWAVGRHSQRNSGKILRWNGKRWQKHAATSKIMRSIHMLDISGNGYADAGIAVGDDGYAYHYHAGRWNRMSLGSAKDDLYGVTMFNKNDAWAVGKKGIRAHWNGQQWQIMATGGKTLYAIDSLGPKNAPITAWYEVGSL